MNTEGGKEMMPNEDAVTAIKAVMEKAPRLTYFGFARRDYEHAERDRQELLATGAVDEFNRALAYLDTRKANKNWSAAPRNNSYAVKHRAEEATGGYISNGVMIAAVIHAGFPWHWSGGPNAFLGVGAAKEAMRS